jgi:hypothetical protein
MDADNIKMDKQVYLRWDNINFYVPAKKEEILNYQKGY